MQDVGRMQLEATLGYANVRTNFEELVPELGCTFLDECPFACASGGVFGASHLNPSSAHTWPL